jgi:hypothetical protein
MRDILREHFDVHDYWDESWRGGPTIPPEEINKHDHVFYLQVINPFSELKQIKIPITWAPMYDSYKPTYPYWKMMSYFNLRILSFSQKMTERMRECGIPTMSVQYYYLKPERAQGAKGNHIFFWYRGGVEWSEIRTVLDPNQIDSFTFLEAPDKDGNTTFISEEDIERYKIKRITGFMPREQFLELVRAATIFIAPRKKEGIGAFTEPLAMGKAVIAYNEGVQNEYITDGVDGFLFDKNSTAINLSTVEEISNAAFLRAQEGYTKWLTDRAQIVPFMLEPYQPHKTFVPFALWSIFYNYFKFIGSLRYYVRYRLRDTVLRNKRS